MKASAPTWDLTQLYANEKAVERELVALRAKTNQFLTYRKKLESPSRELIEQIMQDSEWLAERGNMLASYSMFRFSQNTLDEKAKALESRIENELTAQGNKRLFFGLWWKELDDKTIKKLLPRNKDHAYALEEMRKYKKHMLSEKEEQLSNIKSTTGQSALMKLYDIITNDYSFDWKEGKKTSKLSEEELRTKVRNPVPVVRKTAYDQLWNQYGKDAGKLGEIYKNIALDWWNEDIGLRQYKSPISIRNLANDLSDETVETFLDVCSDNTRVFQSYFEWKAKTLRHGLSRYHVYAPFPSTQQKWSFEEGYQTVMDAYESFSPRFKHEAHRVRADKKMDAGIRKGKKSGGYCASVQANQSNFVFINWAGNDDSVSTLAHELGHAIHHQLAGEHSIFTNSAGLPLSETASTFGEMILNEHLLEKNSTPEFQLETLTKQMDDAYASVTRQAFFTLFEKEAFDMVKEGKTIPELSTAYMGNLRTQFGKKMQIPFAAQYEWLSITHFFQAPFYTYAYAFGYLLVLAFYDRYQREGKSFVKDYERFLSYGGSKDPEAMLLEMGFDPRKKKSWENGFRLLETKLKEIKSL